MNTTIEPVEELPADSSTMSREELVGELNKRFRTINGNFATDDTAAGSTPSNPVLQSIYQASSIGAPAPVNPWNYESPVVDAWQYLDPLFNTLRLNNLQVNQAMISANAVGNIQLQVDSVTARVIQALTITGSLIAADTVTADKMNVSTLSAITANMGTIIAGNITLDTGGFIRGGATAYNTGTGFWMGYSSGAYQFFIGTAAGNKLTWDGSALTIVGNLTATTGTIGGWTIGATSLSAVSGGNTTILSSGATAFSAGPTGSPKVTITQAGALTATSGTVGGWTLAATTLSANNAVLDSAGQLALGTGNDIAIISATNATYRMWIGNATAGSAAFSVTKAGTIFSNSGTIGGFLIGTNQLSGSGSPSPILLTTGGTIASLIGSFSTSLSCGTFKASDYARVMGSSTTPSTGAGIELAYTGVFGAINSYDRTGGVFKPLYLQGSIVNLGGATSHIVNFVAGAGASAPVSLIPAAWLDVQSNGGAYKIALYT